MLSTPSICWRWNTHVFFTLFVNQTKNAGTCPTRFNNDQICRDMSAQFKAKFSWRATQHCSKNVYTFLNLERKILLPGGARVRLVCTNHLYTKCTHQIEFHTFHMQCFLPRIPLTGSLTKVQLVQRKIYLIKAFLPKTVWWCTSVMLTYLFLFCFARPTRNMHTWRWRVPDRALVCLKFWLKPYELRGQANKPVRSDGNMFPFSNLRIGFVG